MGYLPNERCTSASRRGDLTEFWPLGVVSNHHLHACFDALPIELTRDFRLSECQAQLPHGDFCARAFSAPTAVTGSGARRLPPIIPLPPCGALRWRVMQAALPATWLNLWQSFQQSCNRSSVRSDLGTSSRLVPYHLLATCGAQSCRFRLRSPTLKIYRFYVLRQVLRDD